jgi:hypothetical protein
MAPVWESLPPEPAPNPARRARVRALSVSPRGAHRTGSSRRSGMAHAAYLLRGVPTVVPIRLPRAS